MARADTLELINRLTTMVDTPPASAQLRSLPVGTTIRTQLEVLLSNDVVPSLDVAGKLLLGTQCAGGGYADVFNGYLLTGGHDKQKLRKSLENKKKFCKYLKKTPLVFKKVAVKRLRVFLFLSDGNTRTLSRELRVWASLDHPNVLSLLGFTLVDNLPCFVSDWMENGTLKDFNAKGVQSTLTPMVLGIARGLAYLHEKGVVHGDLKPDNILVSHDGRPVICDFGVSRIVIESATVTGTSSLKGNLRYMAPELLSQQRVEANHAFHTKESDVWAFGMIIYEILSGHVPFHTRRFDTQVMDSIVSNHTPMRPATVKHDDFEEMWYICWKSWDKNPRKRPKCSQVVTILETPFPPDLVDPRTVPAKNKEMGADWVAVYNAQMPRTMAVELVCTLEHESDVHCVRFSPDGLYIATGSRKRASIFDTASGKEICILNVHEASGRPNVHTWSLCFSPDGKYLATSSGDRSIQIWDIAERHVHRVLKGSAESVYSLCFSHDGRFCVSGSGDRTARVWNMQSGKVFLLSAPAEDGRAAAVFSVAISPDAKLIAGGCDDHVVRIWNVDTRHLVEVLKGHTDRVCTVAFTPDGKGLVSGSLDRMVKHWDLRGFLRHPDYHKPLDTTSPALRQADPHAANSSNQSDYDSADSSTVVLTDFVSKGGYGERGSVCSFDFIGHKNYVESVAVSADGKWIVSGSRDRDVRIWNASTAEAMLLLRGHALRVNSVDLNPAGDVLATGSYDRTVRLWRLNKV